MKIGIDARLIRETGVGRYIENLIIHLSKIDKENAYVVFLRNEDPIIKLLPKNWRVQIVDVRWHSFLEQILLPIYYYRELLDLLHIPYFNIPVLYVRPYVVTIHDLIINHVNTGKASTLPYPIYKLRRLGYQIVLRLGLHNAKKIIAVSQSTKREILEHYQIPDKKIRVIYEGVDSRVLSATKVPRLIQSSYFMYVGNAYPHKNLIFLLQAFELYLNEIKLKSLNTPKLVFVGKSDYFYRQLQNGIENNKIRDNIIFWGEASDQELSMLYKDAVALISPSVMEGFGFPPLESILNKTPVLVSNIPIYKEIYGDWVVYFTINDVRDLVDKMVEIWEDPTKYKKQIPNEKTIFSQYNWNNTALKTLQLYTDSLA